MRGVKHTSLIPSLSQLQTTKAGDEATQLQAFVHYSQLRRLIDGSVASETSLGLFGLHHMYLRWSYSRQWRLLTNAPG